MATSEVVLTDSRATVVNRKRAKPSTRKCQHCKTLFTPVRATAKYCSDGCRVKAYKARRKPARRAAPVIMAHRACAHCGASFEARGGRGQVYCTPSCRVLACRVRRSATIQAMADYLGSTVERAADAVELYGLATARRGLEHAGFQYDSRARRWLIATLELTH
jgi:predicted nucleic acid-binding Zn ribbon protein